MNFDHNEDDAIKLAERRASIEQAIKCLQAARLRYLLEEIEEQVEEAQQSLKWGQP